MKDEQRIWLMLFELYDRQFKGRNSEEKGLQADLYKGAEVAGIMWNSILGQ